MAAATILNGSGYNTEGMRREPHTVRNLVLAAAVSALVLAKTVL